MIVGVIGGHVCSKRIAEVAFEVGRTVAECGHTLVCGGLSGVMEHACKGAKSVGGKTIGILPGMQKKDANPFVDIAIPTGMGHARNVIVVLASDVLVAIDGKYGTLSEIAYALQYDKRVFGIDTWCVSDDIVALKDAQGLAEELKNLESLD